ncbi:cation diffusion facilitator family transporter [Corynebacterium sp. H127]|uniref:cation diffusion facilitator family transporter n=1 Tax=Corynebacterium sp. H127 TaxID=3133418 RepID=UPI0030A58E27
MLTQPATHDHEHGHTHAHAHGDEHGLWQRFRHAILPHSHDHADMISDSTEATKVAIRAAWLSLAGMAATALLQVVIVAISGSVGLLADTIHNIGHLVTTIPLIIALRISTRPATKRYTFGFKRAEDLVGLFIGLVIAVSVVLIFIDAFDALRHPRDMANSGWVLAAAIIGALGNEAVAQFRIRSGRRVGSAALIAEGQHARTDALTSVAVIFGVVGTWLGFSQLDAAIGLFIGVMVLGVLLSSMRSVLQRLLDGSDPAIVDTVQEELAEHPELSGVQHIRARWLGHQLWVEADVDMRPDATVADMAHLRHHVGEHLKSRLPRLESFSLNCQPVTPPASG